MGWLDDVRRDATHGIRLLRHSPVFTITATLSLAIGIGLNTAIFAVANSLLFRPPAAVTAPDALVDIGTARGDGGLNPLPYASFEEIRRRATSFSGVFAQRMFSEVVSVTVPGATTVERAVGHHVTSDFFSVLGARPSAGRLFEQADESGGGAVLDHAFWSHHLNSDPLVVGRTLRVNGQSVTIVGVAEPGFQGTGVETQDLWLAIRTGSGGGSVHAGGRLRAGVSPVAATAEIGAIGDALAKGRDRGQPQARLALLRLTRAGANRNVIAGAALALMALVSLILAAACANIAGIMLARSFARSREMVLRTALGALRGRLVRQLLTETAMVFLLGGAMGLALARVILVVTGRVLPAAPSIALNVTLDLRVLAFALSLSLIAAVVTGVMPALRASKRDPIVSLKGESRSISGRSRLRGTFVVAQITLSVLIVALAGLFVRALRYAGASDPGFEPRGVEVASLDLSMVDAERSARTALWRDIITRVRSQPAVQSASLARVPPGGWEGIGLGAVSPAGAPVSPTPLVPSWNIVESGYFETLRIPLVDGRDFLASDTSRAPRVAIVGETIARQLWPGRRAVGQRLVQSALNIQTGEFEPQTVEVVGVAGDIKSSSLIDGLAASYVYLPVDQAPAELSAGLTIVARSRNGTRLAAEIAGAVHDLNPNLVVVRSSALGEAVALGVAPQRVLATVATALGVVGLLLASVGIYGIVAFTVVRRRQEFGIRMALGAARSSITWMVVRQGLGLVIPGVIIGLGLAALVGQVLSGFLYALPPLHAPTFVATVTLFSLVGVAASYLPARGAVSIQPLQAMRGD